VDNTLRYAVRGFLLEETGWTTFNPLAIPGQRHFTLDEDRGGDWRPCKTTKRPFGLVGGATENATTAPALIDNLVERGLDPIVRRLFIIDGAKALSRAIRRTFG